jgi:cytochrome P450
MEQTGDLRNGVSHLRLRAILREALGPAALRRQRVEQGIEHIGRVLLERIEARGAGYFDLISDLAAPLSLHVLVALVGLPTHQVHLARFACWMEALASVSDQFDTPPPSQDVAACLTEMHAFFLHFLQTEAPRRGTLMGTLAAALDAGQVDGEDILATCWLWLAAGHRHTVSAGANCLRALLRHPEQLRLVRRATHLIAQAVEEGLRYDPPVQWVQRRARVESEIAGVSLRAGQRVVLGLAAANRDSQPGDRAASHPDMFDLRRAPGRHLSFGYGPHFCLGFRLARLQIATVLRLVLSRFSHLELVEDGALLIGSNPRLRSMQVCPVHFSSSASVPSQQGIVEQGSVPRSHAHMR